MTSLQEPTLDLIRAALDPATKTARRRLESPLCQVVVRAAKADLARGGAEEINMLAIGAGVAAAGLTAWLAQERNRDTADVIGEFERVSAVRGHRQDSLVEMLKSLLTGPKGMEQTARFMVELFHDDEEGFYDLIVDLGGYIADCIGLLAALDISSREETLEALDEMLDSFFNE